MTITVHPTLPQAARDIRQQVFVEEQGFQEEFDQIDQRARHLLLYQQGRPVATCRLYADGEKHAQVVGRLAVLPAWRGRALGAALLRAAEEEARRLGGGQVLLAAQVRARGFYEKQGYTARGAEFLEEDCPHIWMGKLL